MTVTRSEIVKRLAEKSGYYQKDIDVLLKAYDDVMYDIMNEVTDEDDVVMQAFKGIRIGCKIVKPRNRINPATQEKIVCGCTVKPFVRWSDDFRDKIQSQYDDKNLEDG